MIVIEHIEHIEPKIDELIVIKDGDEERACRAVEVDKYDSRHQCIGCICFENFHQEFPCEEIICGWGCLPRSDEKRVILKEV